MRRRICAELLAIVSMLALSACDDNSNEDSNNSDNNASAFVVKLPDRRNVVCVSMEGATGAGGVTCDWAHAE